MNFAAKLEIHFHDQERVAVLIDSNGGRDELLGELTLFAAYACRQMVNLDHGPVADSLANLLIQSPGQLRELAGHRNRDGAHLVDYAGSPGRRRFEARLDVDGPQLAFKMDAKGFGFLAQGVGFYAPTSVTMLLQYLVERRLGSDGFVSRLEAVAATCGEAFLDGRLTLATQTRVALFAIAKASELRSEPESSTSQPDHSDTSKLMA